MSELGGTLVLVTGATGFIGGRLAQRLIEQGARVRVYVRDPDRLAPAVLKGCEVHVGDLANRDALTRALDGAGVVFHCAANVHTWDTWEAYQRANIDGVRSLLEAISVSRAPISRLVHVSTVDVYGFPVEPCDEDFPANGGSFGYGKSKWLGESLLRSQCEAGHIPYTVIRPCNVIGPGSQFITRIGHELRAGLMLKVDGGHANAGLVFIDNLIDYMIWAASSLAALNQCYNVRDAYDATWADFIARLRTGIAGRGLVLTLPFAVADWAARFMEFVYGLVLPGREPLLHRLLVRFFGRTCGHPADKIRAHSGLVGKVGFDQAMALSADWFNKTQPK